MKLIILSITPYKEKDGIVTALSADSIISFSARGILNPKSNNHILNNPLIEIDATFQEGNYKYKVIKNAKILFSPYSIGDSLNKLGVLSLIQETTKSLVQEGDEVFIYDKLKSCLEGLKSNKTNVFHIAINYLYELLRINGNELFIDGCVLCGNRNTIVGMSFADGGFICKDCVEPNFLSDISLDDLLTFRKTCRNNNFETTIATLNDENGLYLLRKMVEFVYSAFGIKLKSIKLF